MATININITVPDEQAVRAVNAIATYHGYPKQILNPESLADYVTRTGGRDGYSEMIDNPQSKVDFLRQQVLNMIQHAVRQQAVVDAQNAAREAAVIDVEKNIPIELEQT